MYGIVISSKYCKSTPSSKFHSSLDFQPDTTSSQGYETLIGTEPLTKNTVSWTYGAARNRSGKGIFHRDESTSPALETYIILSRQDFMKQNEDFPRFRYIRYKSLFDIDSPATATVKARHVRMIPESSIPDVESVPSIGVMSEKGIESMNAIKSRLKKAKGQSIVEE